MPFRFRQDSYLGHIASWRFALTFAVVFAADHWLEQTRVVERAALGAFDAAMERTDSRPAEKTAVVGISAEDVQRHFGGRRPVPAVALDSVVRRLLGLNVGVLVVDVFTDDSSYRSTVLSDTVLLARQQQLVWARFVDTTSGEVLPAVGGLADVPGRAGVAAMIADEDRLVRRFRLRFVGRGAVSDTLMSLPQAAALAYAARRAPTDTSKGGADALTDTSSIGLRVYGREPPFFLLDDVLSADAAQVGASKAFAGRVVVLGFIDGSDQVVTPHGIVPGPQVVADAIETAIDARPPIKPLSEWVVLLVNIGLALLIAFIHYKLPMRAGAAVMIPLAVVVAYASFFLLEQYGIWTNYILIVISIWIEQLYENISAPPHPHDSEGRHLRPALEEIDHAGIDAPIRDRVGDGADVGRN